MRCSTCWLAGFPLSSLTTCARRPERTHCRRGLRTFRGQVHAPQLTILAQQMSQLLWLLHFT